MHQIPGWIHFRQRNNDMEVLREIACHTNYLNEQCCNYSADNRSMCSFPKSWIGFERKEKKPSDCTLKPGPLSRTLQPNKMNLRVQRNVWTRISEENIRNYNGLPPCKNGKNVSTDQHLKPYTHFGPVKN